MKLHEVAVLFVITATVIYWPTQYASHPAVGIDFFHVAVDSEPK